MGSYLPGIHEPDQQAAALFVGKPGTVVFTEAIGSNPNNKSGGDYRWWAERGYRVIVRLNNGYKPDGTIPAPSLYESFAQRCATFVAVSQGCQRWIIGNEPNHEQERPNGQIIRAVDYARCFMLCRNAIKRVNSTHKVIVAAVAPWDQTSGDWLAYWRTMLQTIADNAIADNATTNDAGADGISLHAYTHGPDPSLITSEHREHGWLWHFRTYRDQLAAVPASMRHLPVDLTETDQLEPWADANTGWVQMAMREVDAWNRTSGNQMIRSVVLYRWPRHDKVYSFADKAGVQDDFREACKQSYVVPGVSVQTEPEQTFMPSVHSGSQEATLPERKIDADFTRRVPKFTPYKEVPGRKVYRLIKAEYVPDGARRFGPDHHILVDVLDASGKRQMGVPVNFYWDSSMFTTPVNKTSEPYGADYGMNAHSQSYGVWVGNFREASDDVFGMGLGTIEQPDWNHHVDYYLVFQEVTIPAATQPAPTPEPSQPAPQPVPATPAPSPQEPSPTPAITKLIWPTNAVRTQRWGENPEFYQQRLGIPYHNGIDHGAPVGTPVVAMADGEVMFVGTDPGYGNYVRVYHAQFGIHTFVAHLHRSTVEVGQMVKQGQVIAFSGATGLTAASIDGGTADTSQPAPHTHTEIRLGSRDAYAEGTFGHGNGRVDPEAAMYLINRVVSGSSGAQLATIDPLVAEALWQVESSGEGFEDGELKIRFEAHIFERYLNNPTVFAQHFRYDKADPLKAWVTTPDRTTEAMYHQRGQSGEWMAFEIASKLNRTAALLSISMGAPQIMGFHYADIGYHTPQAMFEAFSRALAPQIMGFWQLCQHKKLAEPMRAKDWPEIVRRYNGEGFEAIYVSRLVQAYRELGGA
ncbi:MAG: DUF3380 domain-containing protein [Caldilineaceae bacterium]|nr:DUF3380 domain-containing protein [Caldilineaceae bacterium]